MKNKQIVQLLKSGKVGVIPTDTIYGIVGSALNPETVERIYILRKRSGNKPLIILISDFKDLETFGIILTQHQKDFLQKNWPNPLSVVLNCGDEKFKYLHRGTNSLAFRMPNNEPLLEVLKRVGPLVAPSANWEGEKPAENIAEAKKYFGSNVAFYVDGGNISAQSSTLVDFTKDSPNILRQGSFKVIT